jgi:hypothetical protein
MNSIAANAKPRAATRFVQAFFVDFPMGLISMTSSPSVRTGCAAFAAGWTLIVSLSTSLADETLLVGPQTPWRGHLVVGRNILREKEKILITHGNGGIVPYDADLRRFSPLPPKHWTQPQFDDSAWARYTPDDLADYLGDCTAAAADPLRGTWSVRIGLRTCFGVADPALVRDLKLRIAFIGGVVVYVNGSEVGRAGMPAGETEPFALAEDYPLEAYTTDDAKTPLPATSDGKPADAKWASRYEKRIRKAALDIPSKYLVKGRNVLAVAVHRAPSSGSMGQSNWSHVGFREATLVSASGAGVIAYAAAIQGPHVWSAQTVDQIAETPAVKSLIKRSWFWTLYWGRGMPVKGVQQGNPFDPMLPVKMTMPRNGAGSGQTVLSDPNGLRGVSASLGPLKGPGGAVLPAGAVQIRYAVQHPGVHYCDALMEKPPENAKTAPVWLLIQAPKDQAPGWYVAPLTLEAQGKKFAVPVLVLVTGSVLPDAKDFSSAVGMTHSPETVAKQYNVELWSEAHFKLMAKTLTLLGQVGNDVIHVPVITSGVGGAGKSGFGFNWQPLIRWVKSGSDLKPDFTLLDKYLDAYAKQCAPPRGISLYIWGAGCAKEVADAYENRRIPTRENVKYSPPNVVVWDPATGTAASQPAPVIGADGSEAFWKPMLDGVRALVVKRGWSERVIMLGLGGDVRPGQKTCELLKQWAPYARWNFLSHFSGDPAPKDGKMIATGGMEVGMMEWPMGGRGFSLAQFEDRVKHPYDFLELPTDRWSHQEYSPPLTFRTMAANWGNLSRIGLDFWLAGKGGPKSTSFFSHVNSLTVPGPDGAAPTVRFQMLREGIQDAEIKAGIVKAYLKLPAEQRKPYQELLDELALRMSWGSPMYLSQCELSYDWPAYVARLHRAAADLAGVKTEATWEQPPK